VARPTDRQATPVGENGDAVVARVELDARQPIHVEDEGEVNPDEVNGDWKPVMVAESSAGAAPRLP